MVPASLLQSLGDRYPIERELGQGGMATVYLAEDVRHRRKVALKVLHPELSAVLGPERFLKEIELTASLQHPHILPLFDSGSAEGQLYYVMPFVEGETLRARLERETQLPIDDALRIAREVADALHYAHARGVIHRDIKPENILLQGGHALVADFGIALAVQQAGAQRMTQTGLSLGTPQYMAPEQAMGEKGVDARTDVYALGCVVYEMLVGNPPHVGSTPQAIIAKVITEKPASIVVQRDRVPLHVEDAVLRALEKLPADRFGTAAEFLVALAEPGSAAILWPNARRGPASRLRDPVVLALGALVVGLGGMLAVIAARPGADADPFPYRFVLDIVGEDRIGPAALSPDGHSIVYSARSTTGRGQALYVRRLDQLTPRELVGTTAPSGRPAISPDGQWVAYVSARRKVMKVPLDGGPAITLGDVPDYGGLDWAPSGDIVIGAGIDEGGDGLSRVNAAGGAMTPLTHVDTARKELSHQQPRILADGKTVLFTIWSGTVADARLAVTSLDDGKVKPLGIPGVTSLGVIDGQLVYLAADGVIMAVPYDLRTRTVQGTPIPVQDSVRFQSGGGSDHPEAFVTHTGGLTYWRGNAKRRLLWADRSGVTRPAVEGAREFVQVRLSPDGRRVAANIVTGVKSDLWALDVDAGTQTPLTAVGTTRNASWSADGRRLLYASTQGGHAGIWWLPSDGSGAATMAVSPPHNPWNMDLSPDGHTVVFNAIFDGTFNLETFTLDSTRMTRVISGSPTAVETTGRFSPDGRWIAYNSDESGRPEVYVRAISGQGRLQVSVNGGRRPVWSRDGRELFFWEGGRLVAASFSGGDSPRVLARTPLFEGTYVDEFDVSVDGRRFLVIERGTSGLSLVIVPSWRSELRRLTTARP
ncbi:MAG: serine/threonine-protein kinase [Cytophagaceae bacterium]|nr:serine/threonine-protein kinase [Gemmatimonadaceae bacterium]